MKFAFADPPYLGQATKYDHIGSWTFDTIEGHQSLIRQLVGDFPNGWCLCLSAPSLRLILPMCPEDARVGAWVKPFCAFKKNVRPCFAWEPVIFWRGRNPSNGYKHPPPKKGSKQTTPKDYLMDDAPAIAEPITLKRGFTGAKPEAFCFWVFSLLGLQADDELVDLFPGSGAVTRALAEYKRRLAFTVPAEVQAELFEKEVDAESEGG